MTHARDKFAPQDSKVSSQSVLACKELHQLLKSFLGQSAFSSPTQLAGSPGWYRVGAQQYLCIFSLPGFSAVTPHPQPRGREERKADSCSSPPRFPPPQLLPWTRPDHQTVEVLLAVDTGHQRRCPPTGSAALLPACPPL